MTSYTQVRIQQRREGGEHSCPTHRHHALLGTRMSGSHTCLGLRLGDGRRLGGRRRRSDEGMHEQLPCHRSGIVVQLKRLVEEILGVARDIRRHSRPRRGADLLYVRVVHSSLARADLP